MRSTPEHDESDLLEKLKERLDYARERLRFVEAEGTRWKRHIQGLEEAIATAIPGDTEVQVQEPLLKLPAGKRALSRMTIKDAVCAIMRQHGHPMKVREILDALQNGGRKVGGQKPADTLRSLLRNYDGVFARTPDHKWMIANGHPAADGEEDVPS